MGIAWLTALVLGPALVSADLRNNGLPLYLSRPFGRWEYVLGKSSVMLIMLSLVTWVPGMLLFLFQSYMAGWDWLKQYWRVGVGILLTSLLWIVLLGWIVLDARWQWNLLRQNLATTEQFAGKSWAQKHRAAEDAELFEFAQNAKRLLSDSELSIEQIAERVGYQSGAALSRVFKKVVESNPGEYRRRTVQSLARPVP